MPDVSIIIPTYNRLWSLPDAILSCQYTRCATEIIVVDDGSTDGTWEWLQEQENLVCLRQENWGKCWAANRGFEHATGKYIKFLDSDDLLSKGSIDEQFELAEKENSDVVVSGYKLIDNHLNVLREQLWIETDDFIAQQLGECDSSHYSAYLFKKTFIADIPHRPDYALRDDRLFVLETAIKNPKVGFQGGYSLLHRVHESNRLQFPSNKILQNLQHLNLYKKILGKLSDEGQLTERRKKASIKVLWELAQWMALDSVAEANELMNWIIELDPNFVIPRNGFKGKLYNAIGFKKTSQLLNFARTFK